MKVIHIFLILAILLSYNRVGYSKSPQTSSEVGIPVPPPLLDLVDNDGDDNDEYEESTLLSNDGSDEEKSSNSVPPVPPLFFPPEPKTGPTNHHHGLSLRCDNADNLRNAICRYLKNLNRFIDNESNSLSDQRAIWNEYTGLTNKHFEGEKYTELNKSVNEYNSAIQKNEYDQRELVKSYAKVADNYLKGVPVENVDLHHAASHYQKAAAHYSNTVIEGDPEKVRDAYDKLVSSHGKLVNVYTEQFARLTFDHPITSAHGTKKSPRQGDEGSGPSKKISKGDSSGVFNHGPKSSISTLRDTQVDHRRLESGDDAHQQSVESGSAALTTQNRIKDQPKIKKVSSQNASPRDSFISSDSSNHQKAKPTTQGLNPSIPFGIEGAASSISFNSPRTQFGSTTGGIVHSSIPMSPRRLDNNVLHKVEGKAPGQERTLTGSPSGNSSLTASQKSPRAENGLVGQASKTIGSVDESTPANTEGADPKVSSFAQNTLSGTPGEDNVSPVPQGHLEVTPPQNLSNSPRTQFGSTTGGIVHSSIPMSPRRLDNNVLHKVEGKAPGQERTLTGSPSGNSSLTASQKSPRAENGLVGQASKTIGSVDESTPVGTGGADHKVSSFAQNTLSGTPGKDNVSQVPQGHLEVTPAQTLSNSPRTPLGSLTGGIVDSPISVSLRRADTNDLPKDPGEVRGQKRTLEALLSPRDFDKYKDYQTQNIKSNANKSVLRRSKTWSPSGNSSLTASQKSPRAENGLVGQASKTIGSVDESTPANTEGADPKVSSFAQNTLSGTPGEDNVSPVPQGHLEVTPPQNLSNSPRTQFESPTNVIVESPISERQGGSDPSVSSKSPRTGDKSPRKVSEVNRDDQNNKTTEYQKEDKIILRALVDYYRSSQSASQGGRLAGGSNFSLRKLLDKVEVVVDKLLEDRQNAIKVIDGDPTIDRVQAFRIMNELQKNIMELKFYLGESEKIIPKEDAEESQEMKSLPAKKAAQEKKYLQAKKAVLGLKADAENLLRQLQEKNALSSSAEFNAEMGQHNTESCSSPQQVLGEPAAQLPLDVNRVLIPRLDFSKFK